MHPLLTRKGRLGAYLAAWLPLAAILAVLLVLSGALSWGEAALLAVTLVPVFAFLCLSSFYLCRALPPQAPLPRVVATLAVAAPVAAFLWVVWAATMGSLLGLFPPLADLPERLPKAVGVVFVLGVLLYLLAVALHYVLLTLDRMREEERRSFEARELAREAELRALKDQLNPHFLFNSLNSISALTGTNPPKARQMCVLLADFLRSTLGLGEKSSIPLAEELALARSYLAVERVRFGDRLSIEEEIDAGAAGCAVPPLLLQPLVENAVRHGIGSTVAGGAIRLQARRSGAQVEIRLENPFDPTAAAPGSGLGLVNVKRRLAARWGSRASLTEKVLPDVFRVELSIPAEGATS